MQQFFESNRGETQVFQYVSKCRPENNTGLCLPPMKRSAVTHVALKTALNSFHANQPRAADNDLILQECLDRISHKGIDLGCCL
ncbi:hypothetical protein E2C01_044740 [Portunus trituberculatus]|uniref:Uncharacterized protein n=1 Tax=Portunus trituberculatus TaxID=210409 RepID=A0A5B7FZ65_PORTR|nr:hypothetical protein [Portunus trituberculatus]